MTPSSTNRVEWVLTLLAGSFAVFGGLVLTGLILMTVISILGRSLLNTPIPGDFELIEIGCAVAVFSFLPYCQLTRGNVVVDFFTARTRPRTKARLDMAGNLLYTGIAALLTWRLALGGMDLKRYNESSMVLQVPIWWGFVPIVVGSGLLTVVCAYTVWRSWREAVQGGQAR